MNYFLLIFFISISLAQAEISFRQYNSQYCYDGDTCYVTVDGKNNKIRLLELDTPEISKPKCDEELELGLKARDYLNDLIENASSIEFMTEYKEDYFGRILSYLIIDGEDVSELIIKNNLGKIYQKGVKIDWCKV